MKCVSCDLTITPRFAAEHDNLCPACSKALDEAASEAGISRSEALRSLNPGRLHGSSSSDRGRATSTTPTKHDWQFHGEGYFG